MGERRPLAEVASAVLGAAVELVRPLRGGAHAETALMLVAGDEIVVRRFPPGDDAGEREVRVLEHISPLGTLVPRLLAHAPQADGGLIVTTVVTGGRPDPALAPRDIAPGMARALALIHSLDGVGLPVAPVAPRSGDSAIARAALAEHPERDSADDVLVHHDFWSGNALWQGAALTGVVDWSDARTGPRGLDVAWCRQDLVLLGDPAAADLFLTAYENTAGVRLAGVRAWDLRAAAHADPVVETWTENYAGIGRPDITPGVLRRRLDTWNGILLAR